MSSVPDEITFVGHATTLMVLDGVRLLTDPLLTSRMLHLRRQTATPAPAHLDRLDAVLISHLHHDHLHVRSLQSVDHGAVMLVPHGAGDVVAGLGFREVRELRPGETTLIGSVTIHAVHAEHDDRRHPRGPRAAAVGYVCEAQAPARRWWFAGDTDVYEGMAALAPIDLALLPVWGWGPTLGEGHMNPHGAARAAALCSARRAVPIHWGTYFPDGLAARYVRTLHEPPHAFTRVAAELAPECEVTVLAPGETMLAP